jgi:hypothetical protein
MFFNHVPTASQTVLPGQQPAGLPDPERAGGLGTVLRYVLNSCLCPWLLGYSHILPSMIDALTMRQPKATITRLRLPRSVADMLVASKIYESSL